MENGNLAFLQSVLLVASLCKSETSSSENGKWKNGKWKSAIKRVKSQINLSSFEREQIRRSQIWCFCKVVRWKMEKKKLLSVCPAVIVFTFSSLIT